jgi:hypothetical protein
LLLCAPFARTAIGGDIEHRLAHLRIE